MIIGNLNELYAEVARRADTEGQHINAADVSRVCSKLFEVLNEQSPDHVLMLTGLGLSNNKTGQR